MLKNFIYFIYFIYFICFAVAGLLVWRIADTKPIEIAFQPASSDLLNQLVRDGGQLYIPPNNGFYYYQDKVNQPFMLRSTNVENATGDSFRDVTIDLVSTSKNARYLDGTDYMPIYGGVTLENELSKLMQVNLANGRAIHAGIRSPLIDDGKGGDFDIPAFQFTVVPNELSSPNKNDQLFLIELELDTPGSAYLVDDNGLQHDANSIVFSNQAWLIFDSFQHDSAPEHYLGNRAISFTYLGDVNTKDGLQPGGVVVRSYDFSATDYSHFRVYSHIGNKFLPNKAQTLNAGLYKISPKVVLEDQLLFEQAQALNLIRLVDDKLVVAPQTLSHVYKGDAILADNIWQDILDNWSAEIDDLIRALYWSDNGNYVRAAIHEFNYLNRSGVAYRIKSYDKNKNMEVKQNDHGSTNQTIDSYRGELITSDVSSKWQSWQVVKSTNFVERKKQSIDVNFKLLKGQSVELQLFSASKPNLKFNGQSVLELEGSDLVKINKQPTADYCRKIILCNESFYHYRVTAKQTGEMAIALNPVKQNVLALLYDPDYKYIRFNSNSKKLNWVANHKPKSWRCKVDDSFCFDGNEPTTRFKIVTSDNVILYDSKQPSKHSANVGAFTDLVGVAGYRDNKLPGRITKVFRQKHTTEQILNNGEYLLTLNAELQKQTFKLLSEHAFSNNAQFASVVVADENGHILAAPSYSELTNRNDPDLSSNQMAALATQSGALSPDVFRAGHNDGSNTQKCGSVCKTSSAVAAAKQAESDKVLAKWLVGMTLNEYKTDKNLLALGFHPAASCYPFTAKFCKGFEPSTTRARSFVADNRARLRAINNFVGVGGRESLVTEDKRFADNAGKFGMAEMLTYSLNTPLAVYADRMTPFKNSDLATSGLLDSQTLSLKSRTHPIMNQYQQFGLFNSINLTANLAEHGLYTQVSTADWPRNLSEIYRSAVGTNISVTPVHIAQMYNSLATGHYQQLSLVEVKDRKKRKLDISSHWLNEIKRGLNQVVTKGTAKGTFSNHPLVDYIFGKTGTAQWRSKREDQSAENRLQLNTVWFAGWVDSPKESKRSLTFTCMMGGTPAGSTGGKTCAPLIRQIIDTEIFQHLLLNSSK